MAAPAVTFRKGDEVKVRDDLFEPHFGVSSIPPGSLGVVKDVRPRGITVHFPLEDMSATYLATELVPAKATAAADVLAAGVMIQRQCMALGCAVSEIPYCAQHGCSICGREKPPDAPTCSGARCGFIHECIAWVPLPPLTPEQARIVGGASIWPAVRCYVPTAYSDSAPAQPSRVQSWSLISPPCHTLASRLRSVTTYPIKDVPDNLSHLPSSYSATVLNSPLAMAALRVGIILAAGDPAGANAPIPLPLLPAVATLKALVPRSVRRAVTEQEMVAALAISLRAHGNSVPAALAALARSNWADVRGASADDSLLRDRGVGAVIAADTLALLFPDALGLIARVSGCDAVAACPLDVAAYRNAFPTPQSGPKTTELLAHIRAPAGTVAPLTADVLGHRGLPETAQFAVAGGAAAVELARTLWACVVVHDEVPAGGGVRKELEPDVLTAILDHALGGNYAVIRPNGQTEGQVYKQFIVLGFGGEARAKLVDWFTGGTPIVDLPLASASRFFDTVASELRTFALENGGLLLANRTQRGGRGGNAETAPTRFLAPRQARALIREQLTAMSAGCVRVLPMPAVLAAALEPRDGPVRQALRRKLEEVRKANPSVIMAVRGRQLLALAMPRAQAGAMEGAMAHLTLLFGSFRRRLQARRLRPFLDAHAYVSTCGEHRLAVPPTSQLREALELHATDGGAGLFVPLPETPLDAPIPAARARLIFDNFTALSRTAQARLKDALRGVVAEAVVRDGFDAAAGCVREALAGTVVLAPWAPLETASGQLEVRLLHRALRLWACAYVASTVGRVGADLLRTHPLLQALSAADAVGALRVLEMVSLLSAVRGALAAQWAAAAYEGAELWRVLPAHPALSAAVSTTLPEVSSRELRAGAAASDAEFGDIVNRLAPLMRLPSVRAVSHVWRACASTSTIPSLAWGGGGSVTITSCGPHPLADKALEVVSVDWPSHGQPRQRVSFSCTVPVGGLTADDAALLAQYAQAEATARAGFDAAVVVTAASGAAETLVHVAVEACAIAKVAEYAADAIGAAFGVPKPTLVPVDQAAGGQPMVVESTGFQCALCGEEEIPIRIGCGHLACPRCLSDPEVKFPWDTPEARRTAPPTLPLCNEPHCGGVVTPRDVAMAARALGAPPLPVAKQQKFAAAFLMGRGHAVSSLVSDKATFCMRVLPGGQRCGAMCQFVPSQALDSVVCLRCGDESCQFCGIGHLYGSGCSDKPAKVGAEAGTSSRSMCPNCRALAQRASNCLHLTCAMCGTHFCALCGNQQNWYGNCNPDELRRHQSAITQLLSGEPVVIFPFRELSCALCFGSVSNASPGQLCVMCPGWLVHPSCRAARASDPACAAHAGHLHANVQFSATSDVETTGDFAGTSAADTEQAVEWSLTGATFLAAASPAASAAAAAAAAPAAAASDGMEE